ncbi:MAG: RpiB/LacA/LacB family sugar-phosphate isomerase [Deltaproteobacteria bacterium]
MKIAVASDHAGFLLKQDLKSHLQGESLDVLDRRTYDEEPCDYPDLARAVGEAIRKEALVGEKGIRFMDAEVGGKIWGLKVGYCIMIGGSKEIYRRLQPSFRTIAAEDGYLFCEDGGAGHFVQTVHNGIEYGMMQAHAGESYILENAPYSESLDYDNGAHPWNQGNAIPSRLLELAEEAFAKAGTFPGVKGYVEHSGKGRRTVEQAEDTADPTPVTALALFTGFRARQGDSFLDKVVPELRHEFGGHAVVEVYQTNEERGGPGLGSLSTLPATWLKPGGAVSAGSIPVG